MSQDKRPEAVSVFVVTAEYLRKISSGGSVGVGSLFQKFRSQFGWLHCLGRTLWPLGHVTGAAVQLLSRET